MPAPWFTWAKSLSAGKSDAQHVVEPQTGSFSTLPLTTLSSTRYGITWFQRARHRCGGCSKSIANLKDVIHDCHNTKLVGKQASSCNSSQSGDHQNQSVEGLGNQVPVKSAEAKLGGGKDGDKQALPGRNGILSGAANASAHLQYVFKGTPLGRFSGCYDCMTFEAFDSMFGSRDSIVHHNTCISSKCICQKCGESFHKIEALELHQTVRHAVLELRKEDSSLTVVEIIFRSSWMNKKLPCGKIDRILKIDNTERTIARFEEYRETVKRRVSREDKKHLRCLVDGNELLRFHGTALACSLGLHGSSNICDRATCNVCYILRSGFTVEEDKGIYTTATSGKAHETALPTVGIDNLRKKHAILVCRVIAGRTQKILWESWCLFE